MSKRAQRKLREQIPSFAKHVTRCSLRHRLSFDATVRPQQKLVELGAFVRLLTIPVEPGASVEAGAAFKQLQDAGMETAKLVEIARQTNAATRDAVLASIEGDAKKAFAALHPWSVAYIGLRWSVS